MKKEIQFGTCTAEGTGYQVGLQYARQLQQNDLLRRINILPPERGVDEAALREKLRLLEAAIPGIGEEIAGACDGLHLPPRRLAVFADDVIQPGRCSQIAALPAITADGHLYLGRSYEFGLEDELCLCVTRVQGQPAQAGFSLMMFGRMDGMNDRGLAVTMSTCSFLQPAAGEGLWFPLVLRALLQRCATVEEASLLLRELPIRSNDNLLIADAEGHACVVELHSAVDGKRVSFRSAEDYLVATNHYQNPDMLCYDQHRGLHSVLRWRAACESMEGNRGRVDEAVMKPLLETPMPQGVCCSYYSDGLGTLRSMLFDVTERKLQVCFGAPAREKWAPVALDRPCENRVFEVSVENEAPEDPAAFWRFLPPGCVEIL